MAITKHEGRELRGFRFRIYPSAEQEAELHEAASALKSCWNWLCGRARDTSEAREAWAERYHGVKRPTRPVDGSPEADWLLYKERLTEWRAEVRRCCGRKQETSYRSIKNWMDHFGVKHDYQIFCHALGWGEDAQPTAPAPSGLLQALCKDYQAALSATKRGQAPPRHKEIHDSVTLRTRTGTCFRMRSAGPRPGKRPGSITGRTDWLNCEVHLPGISSWIPGRLGADQLVRLESPEFWVEGVSLVEESDGWYAAIRQWVEPSKRSAETSLESRWAGYGLPTAVRQSDVGRSPNWLITRHNGWEVQVRDLYPSGVPGDDPVLVAHRWRVSLRRPDGTRMNPRKACPTRVDAEEWGKARVDSIISHQKPGTTLDLSPVRSPASHGGELRIGVDSGLANLVTLAFGDGSADVVQTGNSRALDLLETVADRQRRELPTGKIATQSARRVRHLLRGVLAWIRESEPTVINIEDGGSSRKSIATFLATESHGRSRKSGGYVPAAGWLIARMKEQFIVREVQCCGLTSTCSHCGKEEGIRIDTGTREAKCVSCGHRIDQDIGTARNARRKHPKSKAA